MKKRIWRPQAQAVYVIWAPNRQCAYVGESINWHKRQRNHMLVLTLGGCSFEIAQTFPTGTTKQARCQVEAEVIAMLRIQGVTVLNAPVETYSLLDPTERHLLIQQRKRERRRARETKQMCRRAKADPGRRP